MKCPLVCAFLSRLLADLDKSSINQDLIDEVGGLWEDAKNNDRFMLNRIAFCVDETLHTVDAMMLGERRASGVIINPAPASAERFDGWLAALGPVLTYYGVEVAEAKMGEELRDGSQLRMSEDERALRQVKRAVEMLGAAGRVDGAAVGDVFYSFAYTDRIGAEGCVALVHALLEVHDVE